MNTPTTIPATSSAASPTGTAPQVCQTANLALTQQGAQSGLSNFAHLYRLQNTAQSPCTLEGYPTVQLLDASQQPLATTESQQTSAYLYSNQQPQTVTLTSGGAGYFALEWSAGAESCPGATTVVVTPPGDQTSLQVADAVSACPGTIIVSPVEPTAFLS